MPASFGKTNARENKYTVVPRPATECLKGTSLYHYFIASLHTLAMALRSREGQASNISAQRLCAPPKSHRICQKPVCRGEGVERAEPRIEVLEVGIDLIRTLSMAISIVHSTAVHLEVASGRS